MSTIDIYMSPVSSMSFVIKYVLFCNLPILLQGYNLSPNEGNTYESHLELKSRPLQPHLSSPIQSDITPLTSSSNSTNNNSTPWTEHEPSLTNQLPNYLSLYTKCFSFFYFFNAELPTPTGGVLPLLADNICDKTK